MDTFGGGGEGGFRVFLNAGRWAAILTVGSRYDGRQHGASPCKPPPRVASTDKVMLMRRLLFQTTCFLV